MRLGVFLAVLILASLGLPIAFPAAAAAGCPSCYGFDDVGDSVFVERSMSPEQRAATTGLVEAARDRVRNVYGSLAGHPRILICATQACYGRFGGLSRGVALLDQALILSPRGTNAVIASHELSHIELHRRLGWLKTLSHAVPQWFDEGLAVVVSDDPRYLAPARDGDRCRAEPSSDMPASRSAWMETAESADLYAKAACRLSRWMVAHGGPGAVPRLAAALGEGVSFETAIH